MMPLTDRKRTGDSGLTYLALPSSDTMTMRKLPGATFSRNSSSLLLSVTGREGER